MRKIKIMYIITGLGIGGAENMLISLIKNLDRNRFDTRIISLTSDIAVLSQHDISGEEIEIHDMKGPATISTLMQSLKSVKKFKPDIIHAHMFHALLLGLFAKFTSCTAATLFFTSHNSKHSSVRRALLFLTKQLRDADVCLYHGQHDALNAHKVFVIPNGIYVPNPPPRRNAWHIEKKIHLLSVGSLTKQKNHLLLIQVLKDLNQRSLHLSIVGQGPLRDKLLMEIQNAGLSEQVKLLGPRNDIALLMQEADIFVLPSQWEGLPLVVLEAGAQGLPVVATAVGALPNLLGARRGYLAYNEDFRGVLKKVIAAPEDAIKAGQRLYNEVLRRHSIKHVTAEHEAAYEEMVNVHVTYQS